ncbi:hypothetical protein AB0F20_29790 [Streptomyces goshikiensis]|uniref:hypothetical protein n=1 Tax=Streptomyces goshikiensis TaxID=1942 RepID=UPI0033D78D38
MPEALQPAYAAWDAAHHATTLAASALLASAYPPLRPTEPGDLFSLTALLPGGGVIDVRLATSHDNAGIDVIAEELPAAVAQTITDVVHGHGWFPLAHARTGERTTAFADAEPGTYARGVEGWTQEQQLTLCQDGTAELSLPGLRMINVLDVLAALRDPTSVRVHQAGCSVLHCACQCPTDAECHTCDACACQCSCDGRPA